MYIHILPVLINSEALTIWLPFVHCQFAQNVYYSGAYFFFYQMMPFFRLFFGNFCWLPKWSHSIIPIEFEDILFSFLTNNLYFFVITWLGFSNWATARKYVKQIWILVVYVISGNFLPNFNTYILNYCSSLLTWA